ncbi:ArpU family phage packaging/lysis transcriptional regulator [Paenibacillus sp. NPDC058367]|uniref:ArpU family phage packaging/lysis transcriptional regulator n=1 Tax=Paenibacillus sp. NPDC058367 TaxID=3346460 RepID=UPI003646E975
MQQSFLPEIDREATQAAVEDAFERYRICKFLTFEEREAATTATWSDTPRSETGTTPDQTAGIAIHNVDSLVARKDFCEKIERVVCRLPRMEKFLIETKYMSNDHDYITNERVYSLEFAPPISSGTYSKLRWKAFYKLALHLNLIVEKEIEDEGV